MIACSEGKTRKQPVTEQCNREKERDATRVEASFRALKVSVVLPVDKMFACVLLI